MFKGRVIQAAKLGAGSAWLTWQRLARRALPKTEGTLRVPGLGAEVTVRRDRWGVPHIQSSSVEDGLFAQGFVSAQDRLWAMDFYRRVVSGRLSEFAGEDTLKVDRVMRTLGMRHVAEREEKGLGPELRVLPEREWEPGRPVGVLSLGKLRAFGLSTNWERELLRADMVRDLGPELTARLDPTYPRDTPTAAQSPWRGEGLPLVEQIDAVRRALGLATEASGSNNWAVSGARSATGMPLIAGDPHLPSSMPGLWYEVELRVAGRFVRGASLPGLPGIYMGQTNDVAWTITNVMGDNQDLFIERIEGERYRFEDEGGRAHDHR